MRPDSTVDDSCLQSREVQYVLYSKSCNYHFILLVSILMCGYSLCLTVHCFIFYYHVDLSDSSQLFSLFFFFFFILFLSNSLHLPLSIFFFFPLSFSLSLFFFLFSSLFSSSPFLFSLPLFFYYFPLILSSPLSLSSSPLLFSSGLDRHNLCSSRWHNFRS